MSQIILRTTLALLATTGLALSPLAGAQNINDISNVGKAPSQVLNLYVFPKGEKTPAQQLKDDTDCFNSARAQSSYDGKVADSSVAPPREQTGGAIKGAIGTAAVGTVIGAIAGNAGKGAAIGAGVGLVGGNANQREANRAARERAAAEEAQRKGTAVADLKRAFTACMDAKGYSVK